MVVNILARTSGVNRGLLGVSKNNRLVAQLIALKRNSSLVETVFLEMALSRFDMKSFIKS